MEWIARNKFFEADRLMEGVTRIAGVGSELCYLVEGEKRALLIDGLAGVGSLKAFVRELTDKPVLMAATHGHVDHVGAAWEYGEVFIHPDDIALMYHPMNASPESRLGYATSRASSFGGEGRVAPVLSDVPAPRPLKTYPIYEGDVFDLGGVKIKVLQVPGHTYGTVVYLDQERRTLYSGDACNMNTLLNLTGSTTIEEYLDSLKHFKTYQADFDVMYGGHGKIAVPNTIIDDGIMLCEKILKREDDAIPVDNHGAPGLLAARRGADFMPAYGGFCDIMYRDDQLFRRPRPVIAGALNYYR